MLEKIRSILVGLSLIVIASLLGLYLYVQMGKGEAIFGSKEGSLPPTNFEELTLSETDSGYLLCPKALCVKAQTDGPAPSFNVSALELRALIANYKDSQPTVRTHHINMRTSQFDFLERLPGQHLPALVSLRILPGTKYTSQLAIFSEVPVGDAGDETDQERVERWIRQISNFLANPTN